ncbi:MAG: hypothetical protein KatS3mg015_2870 [Fimbriimonadales bacterium]|nr:MAG: hypothetical protein KatS3mg015_2870 [Fimbriimonadales bacterium]
MPIVNFEVDADIRHDAAIDTGARQPLGWRARIIALLRRLKWLA